MTHTHIFTLTHTLPMGIADADGWAPTLVVRKCRTCAYTEALHGTTNFPQERSRLAYWEVWTAQGLDRHGPANGFRPTPRSTA